MLRAAAVLTLGLAAAAPAYANAERRPAANEMPASAAAGAGPAGTANHDYVRGACDTRRPSCRKWRALAHDRIQSARDGN